MKKLIALSLLLPTLVFARGPAGKASPQEIYENGVKLYDKGQFKSAEREFLKALKADGKLDKARFQLAAVYHIQKKNKRALSELEKVKNDPEVQRMVPLLKGNILLEEKRWKDALGIWEKFPEDNADLKSLRFNGLARSYEGLGKAKDAASAWTSFMELQVKPTNEVFGRIAENFVKAGEKEQGLEYCAGSKKFEKQKSYASLCEAHIYKAAGEKEPAIGALKKALELDKGNIDAGQLLALWQKKN